MGKIMDVLKNERIVGGVMAVGLVAVLGVGVVNVATAQEPATVVQTADPASTIDLTQTTDNGLAAEQEAEAAAAVAAEQARLAAEAEAARIAAEQAAAAEAERVAAEQAADEAGADEPSTGGDSGPTLCPDGTTAQAVDDYGNESNCVELGGGGEQCVAYNDANECTAWLKD